VGIVFDGDGSEKKGACKAGKVGIAGTLNASTEGHESKEPADPTSTADQSAGTSLA